MKPTAFEYHPATTSEEATSLLAEHGSDAKVLAGGQSLVPLLALRLARVDHMIDVNGVGSLSGIRSEDGLRIGSVTRHRTVEKSPVVVEQAPLLAAALAQVGHVAIRNRGTIGGSLAHADPAAELPAALLALDGKVVTSSHRGSRIIDAGDLFTGFLTTSLEPEELLTEVVLPPWNPNAGWSVQEFARRSGDFAIAGVLSVLSTNSNGRIDDARIALIGVASTPVRATSAEQALTGEAPGDDLWSEAAERALDGLEPPSDLHGSTAYRRHLTRTLVRRSLHEAASRIGAAA